MEDDRWGKQPNKKLTVWVKLNSKDAGVAGNEVRINEQDVAFQRQNIPMY